MATVKKPLPWCKVRSNSRKKFDEAELRALGKSLRVRQLQPLVCLPDGTIVCGERRFRAAVLEGLTELEASIIEDPVTEAEFRRLQFTENIQRAQLTPYEQCMGAAEIAKDHPGWSQKQLAEHLNVDPGTITRWLAFGKCITAVQQALAEGRISLTHMCAISRLPAEEQESMLALALNGSSRDVLAATVRKAREGERQQKPESSVERMRIPLASDAASGVVTLTGDSIDFTAAEALLKEALRALRAAKERRLSVTAAQKMWRNVASAGQIVAENETTGKEEE